MALLWGVAGSNAQTIPADGQPDILVGTGPGRSLVRLLSGTDGSELISGFPWGGGHTAGARVAAGDITGDGVVDLIVATGPGDGRVSAFNGADASLIITFAPFGNHFRGGVHLATGDIDGDGHTDLIVAGGEGSGRVRIYSSATYQQLVTDFPFGPDYRGGITVAAGDVNGDGHDDVITAQETGAGVRVFDGATFTLLAGGTPYGVGFEGGMYVAAGDVDGDGQAEVITGPRAGSHTVVVINAMSMQSIASFTPFATGNGISVATGDLDGDGIADLVVGSGAGVPPRVRAFRGPDGLELLNGLAFDPSFLGGVFVATTAQRAGLRFTSDDEATFEVGVNGAFTITTVGPSAPITMTGTLPTGVTFTDNGDGTAALEGTPAADTGAAYALTFTAGAGTASEAVQDFTLRVNQAPAITSVASTTFPLGAAGTFTVTTSGFPAPAITLSGAALPTGVTFTDNGDGTATLAGTPAPGSGGTYALVVTAANTVGTDATQAFTFTVDASPVFASAAATTFQVGTAGTFSITASATPAVTAIAIGGAPLPPGVTFTDHGDGTATLAGTPAAGTGGTHALTFTATNGVHTPTVQNFTLTVNEAPAMTSAAAATFPVGAATTFTITTSGFPAPALTQAGALPAGVTFADNGNGTATLSGTPTAGGVFALTITAANSIGANAVQAFTLTVDSSPGFSSAAATTFPVGIPGTFAITTVGTPSVNAIALGGVPLPAGLSFVDNLNGTATLSGTPAAATGGTYTLTFTASNGVHAPVVQNFTLTVTQAPVVTSASSTTFTAGMPGTFTMTTTGFPAPSLVALGALPAGVTFVDNGDGTATLGGTPAGGSGGSYPLSITAANGVVPDAVQAFTLNLNEAPAITSANTATFSVGAAGTFTVTASGLPVPALTITGALPAGVTFIDNGNGTGTLSGTPAVGTNGTYALTFTASNGVLPNGTQAFTLNVNGPPAITSAAGTTFTAGAAGSFTVTTSGFPLPTLAIGGAALPAGLTFVDNGNGTGTLAGAPPAGTGGTYALTFTATNTVGTSAPQAFTLTVNQAPAITSATSVTFVVGTPGTFTVTTTGFPTPAITRTGAALPGGVTFTDNGNGTGTLSGTPAAGTAGSYASTFTATNSTPPSAGQAFTLNVNQPPAITSAASTTFTVGTPATFTVTTTGFPTPTVSQTGALPTGVTFTPATRVLGGTATQTGAFPLVFTATNAVPPDATQNFTLNVVCPAITVNPAVLPDGLFNQAYGPVNFTQTGSTGTTFTWGATGLPAGLALSTAGVLSGTPTNTVVGAAVSVTVTDNFGCTGTRNTTLTVRPLADNESYLNGVGHTQFIVGAAPPATPHVFVSDTVLTGDQGPGTLAASLATAPANGAVTIAANGTFVYTPNVNFAGPTDAFAYTLTDGNGVTNTGTVTISLANVVWYVNSAAGAGGDGRSHSPFNTLASVGTPSISTHYIYVHTGGAATPGDLTLDVAQTLHGQGAAFALGALTLPSGTRPTLTGTVTLANNTVVRAVNFNGAATALSVPAGAYTAAVLIDQVSVMGGTTGLQVGAATGVAPAGLTVSNTQFTNLSGAEISMSGGNLPVSFPATTTVSSNAGGSITIQNRTGGTVTFASPVTVTAGTGVSLATNTGSTIAFTGGLLLSTGGNPAFAATGGGTVTATQNNTTIVNTITTTTGTALNVANTTIAAAGLTFRSVSANGAANGIALNNTGATAGLTVTGTGSTIQGGDNSGGTIQNTSGHGISLTNTTGPSFRNMRILNTGDSGVNGTQVNGFSFTDGTITGAGDASDENSITFDDSLTTANLTGVVTITNNVISQTEAEGIDIQNFAGTITNATISNNALSDTGDVATPGSAVSLLAFGTPTTAASITRATLANNTITDFRAGVGFQVRGGNVNPGGPAGHAGIAGSATDVIAITGNLMNGGSGGIGNQPDRFVTAGAHGIGQGNFNVSNNGTALSRIRNIDCIAIELQADGPVTVTTTVQNNFINANSAVGCAGIAVGTDDPLDMGAGTHTTTISGNNVMGTDGPGIYAIVRDSGSTMRATVVNNTVAAPIATNSARAGIRADSGSSTGDTTLCLQISGNTTAGSTNSGTSTTSPGINLRKQGTDAAVNVFGIVGLSPSPAGTPAVENHTNSLNTSTSGTFGVGGTALLSGASGFVSCTIP